MRSTCPLLSLAVLAASAALAGAQSLDPDKRLSQHAPDRWGEEDGLPAGYVWDVAQTPDGYLWLASGAGLARFDGLRFTTFDSINTPALTADEVTSLDAGRDRLWIGTSDGAVLARDGRGLARLAESGEPSSDSVMAILEDRDGDVWTWRAVSGLARYRRAGGRLVDAALPPALAGLALPPHQKPRRSIVEDRQGRLWLASHGGGLYVLDGDELRRLTTADGLSDDFVHTVAEDPDGGLWLASHGGLDRYRDGRITPMSAALGLPAGPVVALAVDREGSLWIGKKYVYRLAGGRLERLDGAGEIIGDLCLHLDLEGSLWIGSARDGLFRLRDHGITPVGPPEGFPDGVVLAVYEDRAGRLRLGTSRSGLVTLDGEEMTQVTTADGLPHDLIWSIHEATERDGELWLGTNAGLARLEGGVATRVYTTADGLTDDRVRIVYGDPEEAGTLWLGTIEGGLSRFRDGTFRSWTRADGLLGDNVRWLHKDREGGLWIGLQNGLQRLAPTGELESFDKEDGLASTRMRAVYEDSGGTLWVGASGGGLSRFQDGRFVSYTRKDGLTCNDVWGILEDDEGSLWLSGGCLDRVPKRDFAAYDAGEIPRLGVEDLRGYAFDRTRCCTAGGSPAGWKRRDGRLVLPAAPGVVEVDPGRRAAPEAAPPIVETLLVDGEPYPLDAARIPAGARNVEIRYTAPSLSDAERLEFRYRLAGLEDEWVSAGARRVAYYSHLPPGRFELEVTVAGEPGAWRPDGAAVTLEVLPFWWQTPWFRAAAALALVVALAAVYRLRTRAIATRGRRLLREAEERRQAEETLRREVEDRERAERALAELREQMAHVTRVASLGELSTAFAHELNQPLTAIGSNARAARRFLAASADTQEVGEILDDIAADSQRAAEVIRRLRALLKKEEPERARVDVNRAVAEVQELMRSESVLRDAAIDTRLEPALPPVEADRVQLQQVLVNLIRNGLDALGDTPAPERRLLVCTESEGGRQVRVSVTDRGLGLGGQEADALFEPFRSSKSAGLGMGLAISKSIVEAHGGRISAAENPGGGATFWFTLPVAETRRG